MTTAAKVVGFLAGLAAFFGLALGLGRVVGPVGEPAAAHSATGEDAHGSDSHAQPPGSTAADLPGGLMVAQDGYALRLVAGTANAGQDVPVSFTVTGPDGKPVTAFDVQHEKPLHLIAVRRDFTGYQHVHPTLGADGTWSTGLDLEPGVWRLFADFQATGGPALTLGTDLVVAGAAALAEPQSETRTVHLDDYTVTVAGDVVPGQDATLTLSVTKDGQPVTDLQPYLGAYGHLVALREGDFAYLHVHPDGKPGDGATRPGPDVVFHAEVPSAGSYRLYFDFQHESVVHTAPLVVTTNAAATAPTPTPDHSGDDH